MKLLKKLTAKDIKNLILEDIKRSGLIKKDITTLKLIPQTKEQTYKLVKKKVVSYKIPYFDIDKTPIKFYRIRFLEDPSKFGKTKKLQRYSQLTNEGPHLYFPPFINWKSVAADTNISLLITEGEKKAAKASKEGLPCLGIGGVWSFMSKKNDKALIDDFSKIEWNTRNVELVFDSDLSSNPQVAQALNTLATRLTNLGAIITIKFLPDAIDNEKQGLDDYLLNHSVEEYKDLAYEEFSMSKELLEMNQEVALIENTGLFWHFKTQRLVTRDVMINSLFSNKIGFRQIKNELKEYSIAKEWCKWTQRRAHKALMYAPGQNEVTADNGLNTWKGWGTKPRKNEMFMRVWQDFMTFFFRTNPDFYDWFIKWVAYPMQHPGTKLFTCVLFHSNTQGNGKTFIGYFLNKIYGDNGIEIGQDELHSLYNPWAVNKQFILGDEITGSDKRKDSDRLKKMITREKLSVNIKFQPHYEIEDCANYMFTSNHSDAMFLERSDRRVAVHRPPETKLPAKLAKSLDKYYHNDVGAAALFSYLLNEVDVSKFNPKAEAPFSSAKEIMQDLSMSDIDAFVNQIVVDPDSILQYSNISIDKDLFTIDEIKSLYDPDNIIKSSRIAISKALSRQGFEYYVTKTSSGIKKLWALRNLEEWKKSDHKMRVTNYDAHNIRFLDRNSTKYVQST